MEFISSDTNVWVDFASIDRLALPFKLPYVYLMYEEAISNELLQPEGIDENLTRFGLQAVELTEEEFYLAEELNQKYLKPSTYDCIALAIAKCRRIILLTGDGALRRAAIKEGVEVMGSIKILDLLLEGNLIDTTEYLYCLEEFERQNGNEIRLPQSALQERIDKYRKYVPVD